MGQTIGKLPTDPSFSPFVNLPKTVVTNLRCAVAEVSESGYSLTIKELEQVIQLSLHQYLSDEKIFEYSNDLFRLFNSDALPGCDCDEIDSWELLGTLCLVSGMSLEKKTALLFDLFDLNEKGVLSINEVTLAFRSLISGARKITIDAAKVTNEDIDQVALEAFDLITPESLTYSLAMTDNQTLTRQQFCDYIFNCPEAVSFINSYDDIVIGRSSNIDTAASAKLQFMINEGDEVESKEQPVSAPWRDQQRFLKPDITDEKEGASPPPMDGLRLEHVCGRNSGTEAVYTSEGHVLFAAGSMVIKLAADDDGYKQEHFNEHSNRVSSLAIFPVNDGMGDMVASSDICGDDCKVCVWSSHSLSSQVTFATRHKNGASKLSFSPSGEILLTMGSNHKSSTIGVYKWRERRLLFTAKMPNEGFYDCSFFSDNSFGVCGEEFVHFWTKAQPHEPYRHYRGATNLFPSQLQMTSITCVDGAVVTGSPSGALWLWEGRVCVKRLEVFRFPITKLLISSAGLFVSTKDGTIHLLGNAFRLQQRIDQFSRSGNHIIETLCYDTYREKILVGDNSNCLREIGLNSKSDLTVVMSCHSTLTDFAVDTLRENIVTVGGDGFVRRWDKDARAVLQQHNLERELSCIAYKQCNEQVAVGFCKDGRNCSQSSFVILYGNKLSNIVHYGHNSQKTLTVCKFSNDGKLVAFGSEDSSIYIHSTETSFPLIAKARGHSTPILTFDFGCANDFPDASFLRSNSISGEALYWNTQAKKQTPLSQRHTRWESQSCIYGWHLEGAHDLFTEEGSTWITSSCPLSGRSIVVGDSSGRLRVFSNPALSKESVYLQFTNHHGSLQKIVLCGESLYTLGNDSCLCKWKVSSLTWPSAMPPSLYNGHVIIDEKKEDQNLSVSLELATAQMKELDFSIKHSDKPSSNARPWMRSIVPPSNYTAQLDPLPRSSLVLERIHGYDGHSARDNLYYVSSGDSIVYSVGKMIVRYDEQGETQNFCSVDGNIKCLAIHQERLLCAVGQENAEHILIVDLQTMKFMSLCKRASNEDIHCLDFDKSGRFLLVLAGSRLTIHDIENETVIASTLTHATETLDVRFAAKANTLVEVGRNFVRTWFVKGSDLSFEEVDMSSMANPTTFYTRVGWIENDLIVGSSTGDVVRFAGSTPISKIKAHVSKITNISSVVGGSGRFAISAATSVKIYDSKFRCVIAIETELTGVRHKISTLSWHEDTRKVLIGTEGNEVWEFSSDNGSNINDGPIVSAHSSSPMAITSHPNGTSFATVADDGFLRVWGEENTSFDLTMPSRACAYSPDGRMLAVGFGKPLKDTAKTVNGKWVIVDVNGSTYRVIAERRDSRRFIREMKWYCGGDRLAVGSDKVYIYELISETNPATKVAISLLSTIDTTSPSIHFDFSRDGKYLRVNTEANELMWFESDPAIRISEASLMKDIEWESNTCVFDWNVQGTHRREGWNVRSLDCYTEACSSVVTGGDDGVVRTYSYPCTSTRSNYLPYVGHGGAVTSVVILKGGSHVVTVGDDHAIMIWRHEVDDNHGDSLLSERKESSLVNAVDATDMYRTALYASADQIMYPTAGVCVLFDAKRSTQNLFQRHDSQIGAVAISTSRQLVASGDSCSSDVDVPTIWIWDPQTCTEIAALSDSRLRGVSLLAFSPDENRLACICSDENHRIFVWSTINGNWNDAHLSAYSMGGHESISFIQFTQTQLITGGRNDLNFWSFSPTLSVSKGIVPTQSRDYMLLCGAMMEDKFITGTSQGSFVTWDLTTKKIVREFQAHNSSVTSLCACPEGIISGSADGLITILSSDTFQKKRSFDVGTKCTIDSLDICLHSNGLSTMKILAVSDSNCFVVSCVTGRVTNAAKIPTAGVISTC